MLDESKTKWLRELLGRHGAVAGSVHVVRGDALEIAAAGGHHLLLSGPPGAGKTMLARSLPGILPPLTPDETLDRIRGRQVWIDHGRHIVTRYAHLDSVTDLFVGESVQSGQVIGTVGSSGFEEGGPHLHFEVRIRDDYLGDWLDGDALLRAITRAFE